MPSRWFRPGGALVSQRGQSTIEYVAVLLLVAILLTAAIVVMTGGGRAVADAVVAQMRRALCIVTGGPCAAGAQQPCVVASHRDTHDGSANIAIVRVGHERYVLRERLSDDSVRLTLAYSANLGAEGGIGGRGGMSVRGRQVGVSAEARASSEFMFRWGRVYYASGDEEAERLEAAIAEGRAPEAPVLLFEGDQRGLAGIGASAAVIGADLGGRLDQVLGGRLDRRSGETTIYLRHELEWDLGLSIAFGGPLGTAEGRTTHALTLDRDGRPLELVMRREGTVEGGVALPPGFADAVGVDAKKTGGGRRWEASVRLDLTDPENAAIWSRFARRPTGLEAARALSLQLAGKGRLDARTYEIDSARDEFGGGLGFGLRLGAEYEHQVEDATLLAAATREPGGGWVRRTDCVPHAG